MDNLHKIILANGWQNVPSYITTSEGHRINSTSDIWIIPYLPAGTPRIDFGKIDNLAMRWVTKRFIQHKLESVSSHAGLSFFSEIVALLFNNQHSPYSQTDEKDNNTESIKRIVENAIINCRSNHNLWRIYRPIDWYNWCTKNYPELGFCPIYAKQLARMTIPGNPKGEAVRDENEKKGPLCKIRELPLIIKSLRDDSSEEYIHLQQKAAVALSIAFGRNPANLSFLKCRDIENITSGLETPTWVIKMPRIKKKLRSPRDDYLSEYLEPELAKYVENLILANESVSLFIDGVEQTDKPLFIRKKPCVRAIESGNTDFAYHMTSDGITQLLRDFVKRHKIISPITNEELVITTRRFRYTIATSLALEGISQRELARVLDHSDTQHTGVYFELAEKIVAHLDEALAKNLATYFQYFIGDVINKDSSQSTPYIEQQLSFIEENDPSQAIDIGLCGKDDICHLDPPYSCYLCEKFRPYRQANHEQVLKYLLRNRKTRQEKYQHSRLGVQLDDVIFAVAQVVSICDQAGEKHEG